MTSPSFPAGLDALANPGPTTETDDAGFELDVVVARLQNCVMAIEQKLGIGVGAPPASAAVLRRSGTGASLWGQVTSADIANLNVGTQHIAGGGTANRVLRTTDGTTTQFAQIAVTDVATASFPTLLGTSGILVAPSSGFQFTGISQAYKHLELRIQARSAVAASTDIALIALNSDFTASYQGQELLGQGATAAATEKGPSLGYAQVGYLPGASSPANYFAACAVAIPNYTTVGYAYKSVVSSYHGAFGSTVNLTHVGLYGATWRNNVAVTTVYFGTATGSNLVPGSIVSLYGWN